MRAPRAVTTPVNPPERCCLCFSEKEKWFIDTGLDTSFDGTFYICNRCVDKLVQSSPDHYNIEQVHRLVYESRAQRDQAVENLEAAQRKMNEYQLKLEQIRGMTI